MRLSSSASRRIVSRTGRPEYPGQVNAWHSHPAGSRSTRACRYPSDMTNAEWAVIEPLLPAPGWTAGQAGSPGIYCMRPMGWNRCLQAGEDVNPR